MTSSNQDRKNNLATLVWGSESMPASRCGVQDCNNGSKPREGFSLHNSPPSGNVLSSWKRFVSSHHKNFNPTGRFVVCSEHFTDVLPGFIMSEDP